MKYLYLFFCVASILFAVYYFARRAGYVFRTLGDRGFSETDLSPLFFPVVLLAVAGMFFFLFRKTKLKKNEK